jgi:hypothetical protein
MTRLIFPRRGIIKPSGRAVIDAEHPLSQRLSFLHLFESAAPKFIRGAAPFTLNGNVDVLPGRDGMGLTKGGYIGSTTTLLNQFSLGLTSGSFFAWVVGSFTPADGQKHYIASFGTGAGLFEILKFSDNNWYAGWTAGTRNSFAATGTFTPGVPFLVGCTWGRGGNNLWVNGKLLQTLAGPGTTGSTANAPFILGNDSAAEANPWSFTSIKDMIYMLAAWDRELSAGEIAQLSVSPYSFLIYPDDEMLNMIKGVASAVVASPGAQFNRGYPTPNFRSFPVETARSYPRY